MSAGFAVVVKRFLAILFVTLLPTSLRADDVPPAVATLLQTYCADCHTGDEAEGEFELRLDNVDWASADAADWEHVHTMVSRGIMPPADADQLADPDRRVLLDWVHESLVTHSPMGTTPLRRLNRREYTNTIRALFGISDYNLPAGFPEDSRDNGFDNQGAALVVAGTHLEAFAAAAASVADQIFPPARELIEPRDAEFLPDDLVISYSSACVVDGAMRLASSGFNYRRHATWPGRFEAPASGVYELELDLSTYQPPADTIPTLTISTMRSGDSRSGLDKVEDIDVACLTPETFRLEIELNRGDTVAMRYLNGPYNYDDPESYREFLTREFTNDPRLAAAWKQVGKPPRGGSGWARVKEAMTDPDLDTTEFEDNPNALAALAKEVARNKVNSGETLVYKYFEQGPNIGIHRMKIRGPVRTIMDRDQIRSKKLRERLIGREESTSAEFLPTFLNRFLSLAFRRPATDQEIEGYVALVRREEEATGSRDAGLHLAVRTALLSPEFLYRGTHSATADGYELATRLSYFLTSGPPDSGLLKVATSGRLTMPTVLKKEMKRLMSKSFAEDFAAQWLHLQPVRSIMPDDRLGRFTDRHRRTLQAEVTETFWHIWKENLPVTDFIAPDFLFTDSEVGWDIYALQQFKPSKSKKVSRKQRNKLVKVDVPRDGRHGGLLSMSALMMATANGVDTQPVLRGVWVLDNIMGMPPPEPPSAVPALTPDTTAAKTVKQRLAAHMNEQSCAVCHREIDPLGFVLENFDPVGRWRDHYPVFEETETGDVRKDGLPVESSGRLPDGTPLSDVSDLKRYLADRPEIFARCLAEKLLTYATGRRMNYRERDIIRQVVNEQRKNEFRFQDLMLALIRSPIFDQSSRPAAEAHRAYR